MSTTPAGPTTHPVVVMVTGPERRRAIRHLPGGPPPHPPRSRPSDQEVLITIAPQLAGVAR